MTASAIGRRALAGMMLLAVSLPHANAARTLTAVLHEGDRETVVGQVTLDDRARIAVVASQPGREEWLRRLTQRMNEKNVMHIDAPPPKGSPRETLASRNVRRDDPAFVPALKTYLRTYYDLELRSD
jgi:hypothetical protein